LADIDEQGQLLTLESKEMGLARLKHYEFPVDLNNVTRAYYERMSTIVIDSQASIRKSITKMTIDPNFAPAAQALSSASSAMKLAAFKIRTQRYLQVLFRMFSM
jgi:hypothetical protein